MPDYAAAWEAVWNPYAAYGKAPGTDEAIKIVVEEVEKTTLRQNLRLLNSYFESVDKYRSLCRDLHANPNYSTLNEEEQRVMNALKRDASIFSQQLSKCVDECAKAAEAFKLAAVAIKRDKTHETMVRDILVKLKQLSTDLTKDIDLYGKNMQTTLEAIRRNP
jgi:hypothetical protein